MFTLKKRGGESAAPKISTSKYLQIFAKGMRTINAGKTLPEVIEESITTAKRITDADSGDLLLIHEQTGNLSILHCVEEKADRSWGIPKEIGQWVIHSGQPYCTGLTGRQDLGSYENNPDFEFENILCVPLIDGGSETIGVIQAANREKENKFKENDVAFLNLLARHVAYAISSIEEKERLQARAEESEMLLTEIHHRLKNNLATITSLIELEYPDVEDPKAAGILRKCCLRIKSISEVHNLLYSLGTTRNIDLGTYFNKITAKISEIISDGSEKIDIFIEADAVAVNSEQTMTCGLILNELIMNACKHAFTSVDKGKITIRIAESAQNIIRIEVSDNGNGIDDDFAPKEGESKGFWVIRALADRIDATVEVSSDEGTLYTFTFER